MEVQKITSKNGTFSLTWPMNSFKSSSRSTEENKLYNFKNCVKSICNIKYLNCKLVIWEKEWNKKHNAAMCVKSTDKRMWRGNNRGDAVIGKRSLYGM